MLHTFLTSKRFSQLASDPCVYTRQHNGKATIVFIWVDDLIIANEVKEDLGSKFKMKDVGKLAWFLAVNFSFSGNTIKMDQTKYIKKILNRFQM